MNLIKIEIEDMAGNINNSGLKIIKDSKAPELEILNPKEVTVNCTEDTFKLKIRAKDGLGYKLNVNGNEVLQAMSEDYTGEDTLREVEYPIQIKDGETLVNIDAADMNGHVTSKQIKFYKNTDKPIVSINTKNVIGKNIVITGKVYQITKLKDKELNKDIAIKEDGTFTYERGFDSYGDNKTITFVGYDSQGKELTVKKAPEENKEPIRKRLGGVNRRQTSKIIAEEFNNGKVDNVVIASGFSYADALAGSTLAKKLNAPILLVGSTVAESQPSLSYIKEHLNKDGKVYILGGKGAVDESIANSIKLLGYNNITRLAGNDRYKTCKAINEQLNVAKGTPVFLVSGEGFADGLSISSVAAAKGYPVLLTSSNTLSKETK